MVGPDTIKKIRPRPKWIRQKVGYFALLVGALFAKIKVSGNKAIIEGNINFNCIKPFQLCRPSLF